MNKKGGEKVPDSLISELKNVHGLICSVLYGSMARGEEGRSSDIDILNIFENKERLDSADLTHLVFSHEADKVVQFVNMTVADIESGKNDALVSTAFKEGEILFLERPLEFEAQNLFKEHCFSIIKYELKGLKNKDKVRFLYKVYGKGDKYKGLLGEYRGEKLGSGALMIEKEGVNRLLDICEEIGVTYESRTIWF